MWCSQLTLSKLVINTDQQFAAQNMCTNIESWPLEWAIFKRMIVSLMIVETFAGIKCGVNSVPSVVFLLRQELWFQIPLAHMWQETCAPSSGSRLTQPGDDNEHGDWHHTNDFWNRIREIKPYVLEIQLQNQMRKLLFEPVVFDVYFPKLDAVPWQSSCNIWNYCWITHAENQMPIKYIKHWATSARTHTATSTCNTFIMYVYPILNKSLLATNSWCFVQCKHFCL